MDSLWQNAAGTSGPTTDNKTLTLGIVARSVENVDSKVRDLSDKFDLFQSAETIDLRDDLNRHTGQIEAILHRLKELEEFKVTAERRLKVLEDFEDTVEGRVSQSPEFAVKPMEPLIPSLASPHAMKRQSSGEMRQSKQQAAQQAAQRDEESVKQVQELLATSQEMHKKLQNDRAHQDSMRQRLEDSLVSFDQLNNEVSRMRRTVMLFQEPDVGGTAAAGLEASAAGGQSSSSRGLKGPNFFRTVNADDDGFDPAHSSVERCFTVLTVGAMLIGILVLVIIYYPHKFSGNAEDLGITRSKFDNIMANPNLIGLPICDCKHSVGIRSTYLSDITYEMDSWCGASSEPATLLPFSETKYDYLLNVSRGTGKPAWICKTLDVLNPSLSLKTYDPSAVMTAQAMEQFAVEQPAADCAFMLLFYQEVVLEHVQRLCHRSRTLHDHNIVNFMNEAVFNPNLLDEVHLAKIVERDLKYEALTANMIFASGAAGNPAIHALEMVEDDIQGMVTMHDDTTNFDSTVSMCGLLLPVADSAYPEDSALVRPLRNCMTSTTWQAQCCNTTQICAEPVYELPCSYEMNILAQRMAESEYGKFNEAVHNSLVKGFTAQGSAARVAEFKASSNNAGALLVDVGYLWTYHPEKIFSAYFDTCSPLTCNYEYFYDHFYGLILVITGLVGGLTAAVMNGCGVLVMMTKKLCSLVGGSKKT